MVSRIEAERVLMGPVLLGQSAPDVTGIHPALRSPAQKCRAVFVRCLAYASALTILTVMLTNLFAAVPAVTVAPAATKRGWIAASRPHPAFTISHIDLSATSEPYQILRHVRGGRKDTLRWITPAGPKSDFEKPDTEIEIYRPGSELAAFGPPEADLAARMDLPDGWTSEAAGVVASKFGPLPLTRFAAPDGSPCLAFSRNFDNPRIQISGWTCQPISSAAQRAFLACTLDRLVLLSAGNDPAIAGLFARAELRRTGCSGSPSTNGDWIAAAQEPALRGSL